ncbi:hypothetical protein RF11_14230 [Thelohanellus kitauei]|uniref:Uncharacterized protein n=1 Tax=Thelohanellus kitauei TaxID=669202 RepID=A0A0C2JAZ6_THEKT|nr:hypothetical protein RF11_14230 [Thelohanellus kitauei]
MVKEYFHMVAEEISLFFQNLPDSAFAPTRNSLNAKILDVTETLKDQFIELVNRDVAKTNMSYFIFWIKSSLDAEFDVHCVIAKTILRIPDLVKHKQAQTMHSCLLFHIFSQQNSITIVYADRKAATGAPVNDAIVDTATGQPTPSQGLYSIWTHVPRSSLPVTRAPNRLALMG